MSDHALLTLPAPVVEKRNELVETAEAMKVATQADYTRAGAFLIDVKTMLNEIDRTFDPVIAAAHASHKAAVAAKKEHSAPLLHSEVLIKGRMGKYVVEERERARREQERLEAEARAKQEQAAREARERAEAERLREAELLEFAGQTEEALSELERPLPPPPPVAPVARVAPAVPKTEGIQVRERWKANVTDPAALLRAVFDRRAPAGFVQWDRISLDSWAARTKGAESFPGLEAERVTDIAAGRR